MSDFVNRRQAVIDFVREQMEAQGASKGEAIIASGRIKMFKATDVENLYKCINSDMPDEVIKSIVAHDFTGLSARDKFFLPKSSQFEPVEDE